MSSGELCVEEGGSMLPMKLPPIKYYLIALLCHCLPKCLLLVLSITAAALLTDSVTTYASVTSGNICSYPYNPIGGNKATRICNTGIATSISSSIVILFSLLLNMQRPCLISPYKALLSGFGMIMEALFAILFLVTGILLARLHTSYCVKKLMMFDEECNSVEISFVAVPVIFFLCTAGWVIEGLCSFNRMIAAL
ncbi:uncharacterized protein [Dysidea avara]|uniref:uncharacterized protein n=1 Tax=Dysidea avara TaxID=196820 RepID=UPI003322B8F1